ncbi:hypothetical protein [Simkania sp.]|uniref:hypothetical protein n=1 Tax=Simkania sp. TaxID=34094 RepID=UPI003B528305
MVDVAKIVQDAVSTQQTSIFLPFTGTSDSIKSKARQVLVQANIKEASTSLSTSSFEVFDNWTFASTLHRIQFIPKDTWKRMAIFVSVVVVAYYLQGECQSYFSFSFLAGAPLMIYAMRQAYLYVKSGTFPKVLQVDLSKKDISPIEHDMLANGTDTDGNVLDMFSMEPIPKEELNSSKYLHLPNYVIETVLCIRGLLGKPELKHPVETERDMTVDEREMLLPQIQRIFNLTEEELLSCWEDFEASEGEKETLLEDFLEDGKLSGEAMEHMRTNHEAIVKQLERTVEESIKHTVSNLEQQSLSQLGVNFGGYQQNCLSAASYEEFQQAIVELLSAISSLQPIRAVLPEGSESISLMLNSTVRVSELTKLQFGQSVLASLGSAPPSSYIDLVGVQLSEANEAQKIDLKPLCDHHFNKLLIRIFKGSELYDSKVKDLEAQKRIDRFEALTGVDVIAVNESDSDES